MGSPSGPIVSSAPSAGGTFSGAWATPAQITADQIDYDPGAGNAFRISSDQAGREITGLDINSNTDGDAVIFRNVGSFAIDFNNEDVASAAANRIITGLGANIPLDPDDAVILKYDATTARWIVIA